tara:strand:+ start:7394 stop:7666 length:273 start_codon:yes stop_codon:yes gene_type:complete
MEKLYNYDKLVGDISKGNKKKHVDHLQYIANYKGGNDLVNSHKNLIKEKKNIVRTIFADLKKNSKSHNLYDNKNASKDLIACSDYLDIQK